jgi:hypothetical protein
MAGVRAIKDHRGIRLVSTQFTLFTLKDPAFVSTYLTSRLGQITHDNIQNGMEFRFLLSIESLLPAGSIYEMMLVETLTKRKARFVFKNQDAPIVKLLNEVHLPYPVYLISELIQ